MNKMPSRCRDPGQMPRVSKIVWVTHICAGVGKSELAKALAISWFGSEDAMVRLEAALTSSLVCTPTHTCAQSHPHTHTH